MSPSASFWVQLREGVSAMTVAACLASCGAVDSDQTDIEPAASKSPAVNDVVDSSTKEEISPTSSDYAEDQVIWRAPESRWLENEKRIATEGLRFSTSQVLVSPVQGGEYTFDPIERSLITRMISDGIYRATDRLISNPSLVFRYLGSHRSTYPLDDLVELAVKVRAPEILVLKADHNDNGEFEFQVSLISTSSKEEIRTRTWSGLSYSDSAPPIVAIEEILDEVVEFSVDVAAKTSRAKSKFNPDDFNFSLSVDELFNKSRSSAIYSAAYLQLIGMLHPSGSSNETRYRLFERSLVELHKASPDSDYYRYFKARAYAYLDRRPAAIALLNKPHNRHERALLAALNGNLEALQKEVAEMGASALDFMSVRDLLRVAFVYNDTAQPATLEQFVDENPLWAPFIYRALRDRIFWADYSAMTVKLGLEAFLPSEATSLESFLTKASVTGDYPSELELNRLLWRHFGEFESSGMRHWAVKPDQNIAVSEIDFIDLARSIAVANHIREVEDDLSTRELPDAALRRIHEFDVLFKGHPAITLQQAEAQKAIANKSIGAENRSLHREAAETHLNGFAWTGQLTEDAVDVSRRYAEYLRFSSVGYSEQEARNQRRIQRNNRANEWPKGIEWYRRVTSWEARNGALQRCIDYSWTSFFCLKTQIKEQGKGSNDPASVRADLMSKYAHRYVGHPERAEFEIMSARDGGDDSEIRQLRSRIEAGSNDWPMYYALGRALKRRGDYQAAQEILLSFPGFQEESRDTAVTFSNYAYDAGSTFYWIGRYELALPLLEISAQSRTGSGASMSAGARVSLITGDLAAAEDWNAARVRRYGGKYAIRDLQQILHIRGNSEGAWSIFDQAQSMTNDPQIWSGALVGHRIKSATTKTIFDWIEASDSRRHAFVIGPDRRGRIRLAARYLLLSGTMDRLPGQELADAIANHRFQMPTTYVREENSAKGGPGSADQSVGYILKEGIRLDHDRLVPTQVNNQITESGQIIESRYEMLARSMSAFLANDFQKAFDAFNETASYYYLDEYLPYYAFSSAAVDRAGHLPAALEAREPKLQRIKHEEALDSSTLGYRFDEDLTYAVLAAFEGRHDKAKNYLAQALNNRPYIEERTVFPYYQIVDLADRLYERTGVELYRDYALELSRRHIVILPMYSWAYFIVAKYSESDVERLEAAASGLALDPLSYRASLLPKDFFERVRKYLADNGAPYLRRPAESITM